MLLLVVVNGNLMQVEMTEQCRQISPIKICIK